MCLIISDYKATQDASIEAPENCVATLGSPNSYLTCSTDAARRITPEKKVIATPTFEEAIELVKARQVKSALVPAAYPGIGPLFMDDDLWLTNSLSLTIPELVFIKGEGVVDSISKCFHHPATTSLLSKIDAHISKRVEVSSNEVAVHRFLADSIGNGVVTNGLVASAYGLSTTLTLRPAKPMGWHVFERA